MSRVVVGMSGGVDSAVTAYLLKMAGHDVIGLTLRTWVSECGEESRCCEIDDARSVCDEIGIPYYVQNCIPEFNTGVIEPFMDDYMHGLTPNPCVGCNRIIKWDQMMKFANRMQAEYVATGHYASVVKLDNGRYTVKKAAFDKKDQTYMLYRLSQEQLSATLMPLGALSKDEVRNIAEKAGISVADKKDSQEICFVPDGDYAGFIEKNYDGSVGVERSDPDGSGVTLTPDPFRRGNFVDESGQVLGQHRGIIHYTVGQRKGLGIAMGRPVYVKEIRPETDEVVLCDEEALFTDVVRCRDLNFLSIPPMKSGDRVRARVKIRYHHSAKGAWLEVPDGDTRLIIHFDEPVKAATPGQSAVFYDDDDCVIGGGVIM